MRLKIFIPAVIVIAMATLAASCNRGDPLEQPIAASTSSEFARWRAKATKRITGEQWTEFDLMTQEIKLRVTADKEASGSEPVDAAMRNRIHGKTFQQVLAMGCDYKLQRLIADRVELARTLALNAQLSTKPGDTASAKHLETLRERQQARLERLDAEIATLEARLKALGGAPANSAAGRDGGDAAPQVITK